MTILENIAEELNAWAKCYIESKLCMQAEYISKPSLIIVAELSKEQGILETLYFYIHSHMAKEGIWHLIRLKRASSE